MGLFDVNNAESLFKNEDSLDQDWVPKILPFREEKQRRIADCIKPLLQDRNGKNLFIFGAPGIGKTSATRWVLRDLEETTEEVMGIYVNCWQKNTTFKIFVEICRQIGYTFTQNKNTEDLFEIIKSKANKTPIVFVFDEIDKAEDFNFLYSLQNDIYKKTILILTNYKSWLSALEERLTSRLALESVEFEQYNQKELAEILRHRLDFAFIPTVWAPDAFALIAEEASKRGDLRTGLHLLRQSGLIAETKNSKRITVEHVREAIEKLEIIPTKKAGDLDDDARLILSIVKEQSGKKIGDLFSMYTAKSGSSTYKTFQRKIERLEKGNFINTNKIIGGKDGTTTLVSYAQKPLTEFSD